MFLTGRKSGLLFAAAAVVALACASCGGDGDEASFSASIECCDRLLAGGQTGGALEELRNAEKCAYSPASRLGVYRRYRRLGENELAESLLKKSVRKFPESEELAAVWGQFLLRRNRVDDAVEATKILSGGKYGSIYSEAVLKQGLVRSGSSGDLGLFLSDPFLSVYDDIYSGTGDSRWLVNSALIRLSAGDYQKASLSEEKIVRSDARLSSREAMFWAKVQFDAGNYDVSLWNLSQVSSAQYQAEAAMLRSDCYSRLNELELAERSRSQFLDSDLSEIGDAGVLNIIGVNSAIWAYSAGQYQRAWDLLTGVLARDSAFVPALLTYGKIAWADSRPIPMTDLEKSLRETELRTDRMREFDARPRFLVEDAIDRLSRVEEQYRGSPDAPDGIDALIVERISLFLRSNSDIPLKARTSEIWRTLELNESGLNLYPPLLVYFSVQKLVSYGYPEEARSLFRNYINAKYLNAMRDKTEAERNEPVAEVDVFGGEYRIPRERVPEGVVRIAFGDEIAETISSMNVWEIELAAYFALLDGDADSAQRLYEFVLFESGGVVNSGGADVGRGGFENVSTLASAASAVNLAMIYSSRGDGRRALALYGLAAGKCEDSYTKSKILYRIAELQFSAGEIEQARISIDYSLSLDPQNADARLLKRKMSE